MRVLFLGNSFTNRNDVPGQLTALAASADPPQEVVTERVIANGASLRQHWNAGRAAELIAAGGWDFVVLQEQSTLPIKNRCRFHENVRLFDDLIRRQGGRTVLYLTWARRAAPETQRELNEATLAIAQETGALVAPVGRAWEQVIAAGDGPDLYDVDGSHPSQAGSYLAACTFFAVLLGRDPTVLPACTAGGLSPSHERLLRAAALAAAT